MGMGYTAREVKEEESRGLEPPVREEWLGRLRYLVAPIIAMMAIVVAVYLLGDYNGLGVKDEAEVGAASAVDLGPITGDPASAPRVGYPAPDFTLVSLDGTPVKLSDFRGKTVFLNFFASWCPPCRAEMPDIVSTYQENKDSDVVILGVDMQEEGSVVSNYATSAGMTFPIVLDRRGEVSNRYRITAIPTSFFIDKNGTIRDMQIGAMSKKLMLSRLQTAQQS